MKDNKNPKKPIYYYYGVILILIWILQLIIMPSLSGPEMKKVDYSKFLEYIDEGKVDSVQKKDQNILFTLKKDESKKGDDTVFITGSWDYPQLTEKLQKYNINFGAQIYEEPSLLIKVIVFLLPIFAFFGIGYLLSKFLFKGDGGIGPMSFGKSNAKIYVKAETGKTFNDVAGQEEAKEQLTEIVDFLHRPEKYVKIGADLPKGALLVGPPGTGKTLLAQAVAGEADVPFFSISGSEFVEMFVGLGAAKVRDLFKQAQQKAPCIVFIDEIDTIGKSRDAHYSSNDEREQTLNQLLTEMDGFDSRQGVVILAATNRPEILDPALLRPGRFDRRIPVELPDLNGRIAVLKVHAKKVKTDKNLDYKAIGLLTAGASGADLANIVNEAALRAVRNGRNEVIQEDLQESVEVVIAGYERKTMVISEKEKKLIAYHEVGHALVSALIKHSMPVAKITIIPRTSGALGYTLQSETEERFLMSKDEIIKELQCLAGGRCAEELIFNTMTTGASNDIEKMTDLARAMVTKYGMSEDFGMMALETQGSRYLGGSGELICSEDTYNQVDEVVKSIIKYAHDKAYEVLKENEDKLHKIAKYLYEKETVSGEDFMKILKEEEEKSEAEKDVLSSENIDDRSECLEKEIEEEIKRLEEDEV